MGSIGQPIFQGGRLTANIDLEDAQVRATLADYAQAILRAFLEVETVLAIEDDLIVREEQLSIAAEDATDAEQLAEARYFAGRQDILTYLSARSSSFDNQSALISARRYRLEQRVDLYLALGGGYEDPAAQDDLKRIHQFRRTEMKTLLKFLLPVIVLALGAFGAKKLIDSRELPQSQPPRIPVPQVATLEARRSEYQVQVPSQGTVIPRTESQLVVEVSGRVTEISPQLISGGFFNEGEMLLRIDPRDYELATAQADLNVAAANRRLAEEQADAEVARKEWERMGRGEPTALTLREPQVAEAKANLISAQAMLERARRDLERTTILAPYSGRVRSKSVDLGQFVNLGSPVATIYATDFAEVRLPLADEELAFVTLPFGSKSEDYKNQPDVELTAVFAGERRQLGWQGRSNRGRD